MRFSLFPVHDLNVVFFIWHSNYKGYKKFGRQQSLSSKRETVVLFVWTSKQTPTSLQRKFYKRYKAVGFNYFLCDTQAK